MSSATGEGSQGARATYRAALNNEKRHDHVSLTVPCCGTGDKVTALSPWFMDGTVAYETVKEMLLKGEPLLFAPSNLSGHIKFLPGPRVYLVERLTGGTYSKPFIVNQLAFSDAQDGPIMGTTLQGKPIGFFFPYDKQLVTGSYTFKLRKNGLGGQLFREVPLFENHDFHGIEDFSQIVEDLRDDPKGKFSNKLYKKLCGGGAIPVDQYMCGADGLPIKSYLAQANKEGLTKLADVEADVCSRVDKHGFLIFKGITYRVVWFTERKSVDYGKQTLFTVNCVMQRNGVQNVPAHPFTLGGQVEQIKPRVVKGNLVGLTLKAKILYTMYGEDAVEEPSYVYHSAFVDCGSCNEGKWCTGNAVSGFACECGASYTAKEVLLQSSGLVKPNALFCATCPFAEGDRCSSECKHTVPQVVSYLSEKCVVLPSGKSFVLAFGGALFTYMGCADGTMYFVPRAKSVVSRIGTACFTGCVGAWDKVQQVANLFTQKAQQQLNFVNEFVVSDVVLAILTGTTSRLDELRGLLKDVTFEKMRDYCGKHGIKVTMGDHVDGVINVGGSNVKSAAINAPFLVLSNLGESFKKVAAVPFKLGASFLQTWEYLSDCIVYRVLPYELGAVSDFVQLLFNCVEISAASMYFASVVIREKVSMMFNALPLSVQTAAKSFIDVCLCATSCTVKFLNDLLGLVKLVVYKAYVYTSAGFVSTLEKTSPAAQKLLDVLSKAFKLLHKKVSWAGSKVHAVIYEGKDALVFSSGTYHCVTASGRVVGAHLDATMPGEVVKKQLSMLTATNYSTTVDVRPKTRNVELVYGQLETTNMHGPDVVVGDYVIISDKVFVRSEEDGRTAFYPMCTNGKAVPCMFKFKGGAPLKQVTFGEDEVHEIDSVRTVTVEYNIHTVLDTLLSNTELKTFVVDKDLTVSEFALVVQEAVAELLAKLLRGIVLDDFDLEDFIDSKVYVFNLDGDEVWKSTMIFSIHPIDCDDEEVDEALEEDYSNEEEESDSWAEMVDAIFPLSDEAEGNVVIEEQSLVDDAGSVSPSAAAEKIVPMHDVSDDSASNNEESVCADAEPKGVAPPLAEVIVETKVPTTPILEESVNPVLADADSSKQPECVEHSVIVETTNTSEVCVDVERSVVGQISEAVPEGAAPPVVAEEKPCQEVSVRPEPSLKADKSHLVDNEKQDVVSDGQVDPLKNYKHKVLSGNVTIVLADAIKLAKCFTSSVLVNAANVHLKHAGGIAYAIDSASKGAVQRESDDYIKNNGALQVGDAVLLNGHGLAANILHVVGPDARQGQDVTLLSKCYKAMNAYPLIVTPLVSSGIFGVDPKVSLQMLQQVAKTRFLVCVNSANIYEELTKVVTPQGLTFSFEGMKSAVGKAKEYGFTMFICVDNKQNLKLLKTLGVKADKKQSTVNGVKYYCYTSEDTVPNLVAVANKQKGIVAMPLGYVTHGFDLMQASAIVKMVTVPYVCLLANKDQMAILQGDVLKGTPFEEFVSGIKKNGYAHWQLVQGEILVNGVSYSKLLQWSDQTVVYSSNKLFVLKNGNLLPFTSVEQCRSYLSSRTTQQLNVEVLVTVDGVNFRTVILNNKSTFRTQLGTVFLDGVDVSDTIPSVDKNGVSVYIADNLSKEELAAVKEAYGVEDPAFLYKYYSIRAKVVKWKMAMCEGSPSLCLNSNNCYLNAAVMMLDCLRDIKFIIPALQSAYMKFKGGDFGDFISLLMAYGNCTYGQPDDASMLLYTALSKAELLVSARMVWREWCDHCGVNDVVITGIKACVYLGVQTLEELRACNHHICQCGGVRFRQLVECVTPWLLLSGPPNEELVANPDFVAFNVFIGHEAGVGHYVHARVKKGLLYKYDSGNLTKASDWKCKVTDKLYPGQKYTAECEIVVYSLDGNQKAEKQPDLSAYYVKDGKYYTNKPSLEFTPATAASRVVYTNSCFIVNDDDAIGNAFNKLLGFDKNKPASKQLTYSLLPNEDGDVLLAEFKFYDPMYKNGAAYKGKPILWVNNGLYDSKLNKYNRASLRQVFDIQPVETKNRFASLKVEEVDEKPTSHVQEETLVSEKSELKIVKCKGLSKPFVKNGFSFISDDKGILTVEYLTKEDMHTLYVNPKSQIIVLKDNWLSGLFQMHTVQSGDLNVIASSGSLTKKVKLLFKTSSMCKEFLSRTFVATKCANSVVSSTVRKFCCNKDIFLKVFSFIKMLCFIPLRHFNKQNECVSVDVSALSIAGVVTGNVIKQCFSTGFYLFKQKLRRIDWKSSLRWLLFMITTVIMLFSLYHLYVFNAVLTSDVIKEVNTGIKGVYYRMSSYLGVTSVCDGFSSSYRNASFNRDDYCEKLGYVCHWCLMGQDSLTHYSAIQIVQTNLSYYVLSIDWLWFWIELGVAYLMYTPAFNWVLLVCTLQYFFSQTNHIINWRSYNFVMSGVYLLTTYISLCGLLRVYNVLAVLWYLRRFYNHVINGCKDTACMLCYKRNRLTRVEASTVVCGVKRTFYITANGGMSFCSRHNWNCVDCDTAGLGNTFICEEVANDLTTSLRRLVKPTDRSHYYVESVEVKNSVVQLNYTRDGQLCYERVPLCNFSNLDKFKFKEVCKSITGIPEFNFVIYDSTDRGQENLARSACVYYSQVLCKSILLVDSNLMSTVGDSSVIAIRLLDSFINSFASLYNVSRDKLEKLISTAKDCVKKGEDLQSVLKTFIQAARVHANVESDVETASIVDGLQYAHKNDIELVTDSFNNYIPSYVKPDSIATADLGCLIDLKAASVNPASMRSANGACVWNVDAFLKLSDSLKRQIRVACRKCSLNFKLTTSKLRAQDNILSVKFSVTKFVGGSLNSKFVSSLFKMYAGFTICLLILAILMYCILPTFNIAKVDFNNDRILGYKVLDNGIVRDIDIDDKCFVNKYKAFDAWYQQEVGSSYDSDYNCPVVVAVIAGISGERVPGVPTSLIWAGNQILFFISRVFATNNNICYTPSMEIAYERFSDSGCVLSSECTLFKDAVGGMVPYCYDSNVLPGAVSYATMVPHVRYDLYDSNMFIKFPEVIVEGTLRVVKTLKTQYCRIGSCEWSEAGVCVSTNGSWMLNNEHYANKPGVYCGSDYLDMVRRSFMSLFQPITYFQLTTSLFMGLCLCLGFVVIFYYINKFKRAFADYTQCVLIAIIATGLNGLCLCFVASNPFLIIPYSAFYYYSTFYVTNEPAVVMHASWLIMFLPVASIWVVCSYLAAICVRHFFWVLAYFSRKKVDVFTDGKLNCTFQEAAANIFVVNRDTYVALRNAISQDVYNKYLGMFNKYKYFSGVMDTAAYREASAAHLAKALQVFSENGSDLLYQPPNCSIASSVLQSGLVKMAYPSGAVEQCIVQVTCGSMTLNGLWLDNIVYCPRHVMCPQDQLVDPNYDALLNSMTNHSFIIQRHGKSTANLRCVGHAMHGTLLKLTVDSANPETPAYTFTTIKQGSSFSVLACYNGRPSGTYTVVMRPNGTIKGSFLCGSCGSVGYVKEGNVINFCYMHQMELANGTHTGSSFDGNMYGNFQDRQIYQAQLVDKHCTTNVVAWLYAAVLNGCNWFVKPNKTGVAAFNEWALANQFTEFVSTQALELLAVKTGVQVEQLLYAIQQLNNGFQGNVILGSTMLEDEYTPEDVNMQMMGVVMQSSVRKVTYGFVHWFLATFVLTYVVILQLTKFTIWNFLFNVIPLQLTPIMFVALALAMLCVKHKHTFLTTFLLPGALCLTYANLVYEPNTPVSSFLIMCVNWLNPDGTYMRTTHLDLGVYVSLCLALLVAVRRLYKPSVANCAFALTSLVMWFYSYSVGDASSPIVYLQFVTAATSDYMVTVFLAVNVAKCLTYLISIYFTTLSVVVPEVKIVLLMYICIGYICTMYFGVFSFLNLKVRAPMGVYSYEVSTQEFRYMNANGLRAPRNSWDAMVLNFRLLGVGGVPCIKIASVQSKLTDLKCTSVVLLSVLQQLHLEANSKAWSHCVKLHNDILSTSDPSEAFNKFAALLATLMSFSGSVDLEALASELLDNSSVLQSTLTEFSHLASYAELETAQKSYQEAVASGDASPQMLKALQKAVNVAKNTYEKDKSIARKLERMAEQAMTSMYKQARAEDKKSKIVSAMQTMLFGMIKKLDNDVLNGIISNARNGCVPLSIIPLCASNKLRVVIPDMQIWKQVVTYPVLSYAGALWDITLINNVDGEVVRPSDVIDTNESLTWPLLLECTRAVASAVKLQNNEIKPTGLKTMVVSAGQEQNSCIVKSVAYYEPVQGRKMLMGILSEDAHLKWARVEGQDGFITIELQPPCKFLVAGSKGPEVRYLYFVKNLNNLHRGQLLGHIAATVRLQAGSNTEFASNSSVLSLVNFAVDPARAYTDYVNAGGTPLTNCVKMLTPKTGTGIAISVKPESNLDQETYGGASVCLYCRAHIEHPDVSGVCKFKGKFVQIPAQCTRDPVGFCLANVQCNVCQYWVGYGCNCDSLRENTMLHSKDTNFLNESGVLL